MANVGPGDIDGQGDAIGLDVHAFLRGEPVIAGAGKPEMTKVDGALVCEAEVSAMRRGSYSITDDRNNEADLSITAFPGDVGGELANVNRWRGQVGLEPLSEEQFTKQAQAIEIAGQEGSKEGVHHTRTPIVSQYSRGTQIPSSVW